MNTSTVILKDYWIKGFMDCCKKKSQNLPHCFNFIAVFQFKEHVSKVTWLQQILIAIAFLLSIG